MCSSYYLSLHPFAGWTTKVRCQSQWQTNDSNHIPHSHPGASKRLHVGNVKIEPFCNYSTCRVVLPHPPSIHPFGVNAMVLLWPCLLHATNISIVLRGKFLCIGECLIWLNTVTASGQSHKSFHTEKFQKAGIVKMNDGQVQTSDNSKCSDYIIGKHKVTSIWIIVIQNWSTNLSSLICLSANPNRSLLCLKPERKKCQKNDFRSSQFTGIIDDVDDL